MLKIEKYKKKLYVVLTIVIGLIFLVSAYSKFNSINSFEFLIVSKKLAGWEVVPYLSRIIILSEFLIGIFLILCYKLKKIVIPLAFLSLVTFSIYLVIDIYISGIQGNCGCFGDLIPMSPLAALIKNVIIMAILFYLYRIGVVEIAMHSILFPVGIIVLSISLMAMKPVKKYKTENATAIVLDTSDRQNKSKTVDSINMYIVDSLKVEKKIVDTVKSTSKEQVIDPLEKRRLFLNAKYPKVNSIFSKFKKTSNGSNLDINMGEKIIALFSLDCEHCQKAASEMVALRSVYALPEIFVLFFGEPEGVQPFFKISKGQFNYSIVPPEDFFPLLKKSPPRILYIVNGNILGDWEGDSFSTRNLCDRIEKEIK